MLHINTWLSILNSILL